MNWFTIFLLKFSKQFANEPFFGKKKQLGFLQSFDRSISRFLNDSILLIITANIVFVTSLIVTYFRQTIIHKHPSSIYESVF